GETRACGRKLISLVMAVCGDLCNPQEGKDIATECCGNQCSDDYIRSACCP
nr:Chain A, Probable insulin-like peptide beta-type 5 [Caenorhabditis elegans]